MANKQMQFDDLTIQIIRKPIKHIYIRIMPPDGQICVSMPLRASLETIRLQLENKREWLHKQRERIKSHPNHQAPTLEPNDVIPFLGKNLTLIIHHNKPHNRAHLQDNFLYCSVVNSASMNDKAELLNTWYKKELQSLLPSLIAKWEPVIGVRVSHTVVRLMKTRWGSCNTRTAKIAINLNLIKKPLNCIEYVLVHEMVHLLEASHNQHFYALMNQYMPDWQTFHQLLEPGSKRFRD